MEREPLKKKLMERERVANIHFQEEEYVRPPRTLVYLFSSVGCHLNKGSAIFLEKRRKTG
jgi:hypothetical protein